MIPKTGIVVAVYAALVVLAASVTASLVPYWASGALLLVAFLVAVMRTDALAEHKTALILFFIATFAIAVTVTESLIIFTFPWFITLVFVIGAASALYFLKHLDSRHAYAVIALFAIITITYSFYFLPSSSIAKSQGTVLSDNWFISLNWIKNNTKPCATVATYWDPGHFIRAIAHRAVVFDGGSQNYLMTVREDGAEGGLRVTQYDSGIHHIELRRNGTVTTARIQDISTALLTSNETLAIDILKKYRNGCDDMYFIASADLIGKSQWWTYFSTWDPAKASGQRYFYSMIPLSQARPLPGQNAIAYTYPVGQNQAFIVQESNGTVSAVLQAGNRFIRIENFFYFSQTGGRLVTDPEAELKGMVWLDPSKQIIAFIPPELQNGMFTRMYFFEGTGLKHFKPVGNWGGEVKLFKVLFDEEAPEPQASPAELVPSEQAA